MLGKDTQARAALSHPSAMHNFLRKETALCLQGQVSSALTQSRAKESAL